VAATGVLVGGCSGGFLAAPFTALTAFGATGAFAATGAAFATTGAARFLAIGATGAAFAPAGAARLLAIGDSFGAVAATAHVLISGSRRWRLGSARRGSELRRSCSFLRSGLGQRLLSRRLLHGGLLIVAADQKYQRQDHANGKLLHVSSPDRGD
jgi:hypothetical protein